MMGQVNSGAHEAGAAAGLSVPTVLVCDDEARLAALTAELLESFGFRGIAVASGTAALEKMAASSSAIQLLLLDVNLTGTASAQDILAQLSASGSKVPVILISGQPRVDAPSTLTSHANVTGYLEKPYAAEKLVSVVREALAAS
jgi:DNA-binding NtrC family response regulator